jgi:hypothetical protein
MVFPVAPEIPKVSAVRSDEVEFDQRPTEIPAKREGSASWPHPVNRCYGYSISRALITLPRDSAC